MCKFFVLYKTGKIMYGNQKLIVKENNITICVTLNTYTPC